MTKTQCILIIVDPHADQHPAVDRGMLLAEQLGMRVDLFVCDYSAQLVSGSFFDSDKFKKAKVSFLHDNKQFLDELAGPYLDQGIDVTTKVAWDRPLYEGIIRQALHSDARFVIKDTHYHSALSRMLFANTDWQLIRSCPSPLWLVQPERKFTRPVILAAVDPLHEHDKPASLDIRLMSEAFEIGDALDGEVHIVHAFNPYRDPDDPDQIENKHAEALTALADKLQLPAERTHMHAGNPADLLPQLSTDIGADLVIMGSIARSRMENAIIGSTAENVLDRLGCDVLVLKPKGFISPVTFKTVPKGAIFAD
ncbi:MAG: universal stress protein [Gammaproteobacteria bacterium]|nr:universal stress protein [Gammaproteobacteria bacterium]